MPELPDGLVVPPRDDVLGQAIPFDRERWLPRVPDTTWWPAELDACPRVGRWPRVNRRTVLGMAGGVGTVEGRRHLLVAALVWGTGTKAWSVDRRGRVFANTSAARIDDRIAAVLAVLREKGAVAAYYACNNDQHIAYLGPAFFTKFLYFAGHENPTGHRRPLILDSVVSRALRDREAVAEDWPLNGWSTKQYAHYLDTVHEQAESARVMPDVVEAAWFAHGKRLPRSGPGPSSD
ncbi:hypothetical protein ACH4VX_31185 [Streptomyces sp. NPDC020731]|uniref:8-oxoguanine DNA glycosylase OGG fold protein n=1 Tax=Streptomyces sp. NPDC020731 TaxID=3365085 RepID=UPI00379F13AF